MRRSVVLLASFLLVCVLMAGAVSAEEVATVTHGGNTYSYSTLVDAFADAVNWSIQNNSAPFTVKLLKTSEGGGIGIINGVCSGGQGGSNIILDLSGNTYTVTESPVGSKNTKNQAFHLEKNNTILIKDGSLKSNPASGVTIRMIIQNYCNLTLEDVTLDGSALNGNSNYTLSNNCGNVVLKGTTKIIAKEGGHAFDVCDFAKYSGVSVTVVDPSVNITGNVEVTCDKSSGHTPCGNAKLIVPYGYKLNIDNVAVHSDTYYWKATGNNMMQLTFSDAPITTLNASIVVSADGTKATLLRDVTLEQTAEVKKSVTLDLNGHKIEAKEKSVRPFKPVNLFIIQNNAVTFTLAGTGTLDGRNGVRVINGSVVVTSGVTINSTIDGVQLRGQKSGSSDHATADIQSGAKLTGEYGVVIYGYNYSNKRDCVAAYNVKLTMNGDIRVNRSGVSTSGNIKEGNPEIIIGPQAKIESTSSDYSPVYGPNNAKWTIEDGAVLTGKGAALSIKGGSWIINGGTFTATGEYKFPIDANTDGVEPSGSAVSITNTYVTSNNAQVSLTINGGTFTSQNGHAILVEASKTDKGVWNTGKVIKGFNIMGGTFNAGGNKAAISFNNSLTELASLNIVGGKYSSPMNTTALKLPTSYIIIDAADSGYKTVAKEVPKPKADVTKDATTGITTIAVTAGAEIDTSSPTSTEVTLKLKSGNEKTGDKIILKPVTGESLTVSGTSVSGKISSAVIEPAPVTLPNGKELKLELIIPASDANIDKLFKTGYTLRIVNEPKSTDLPSGESEKAVAGFSVTLDGLTLDSAPVELSVDYGSMIPQVWHANGGSKSLVPCTYKNGKISFTAREFSSYYVTLTSTPIPPDPPQPVYSSGDGNMENAFRVLFETQGGSYISPATGLSYGDKITAPANPVRDGYTFGGWYKDAACTQAWSFSDTIDGDMTLYAKWTGGSAAQQTTTATASATAQPTTKQTSAPAATTSQSQASATTAAPAAITAAGGQPTLTQAPAPVFGALLGLLAAGVLLRRRD